jgi:hypothetical protein
VKSVSARIAILALASLPFVGVFAQETQREPPADQVFKNIKVFNGVPASDLIPAMEFMSASLKYQCSDCHDPKDFAADNKTKETTRHMILMQRDINQKHFNGKLEVTCMTCHRGSADHPLSTPLPAGILTRHQPAKDAPKPEALFEKHIAAAGNFSEAIVREGTLTAPNDETHQVETLPLEFVQSEGGKFKLVAGTRTINSDGPNIWYGGQPMFGEPAAIFGRIGRSWYGKTAFEGLARLTVSGTEKLDKKDTLVVRGTRMATTSTEELYFDAKSGLLTRLVNLRRSTLGTVVAGIDYANYKSIGGAKVPMKVAATFAGGEQWIMSFKSAKFAKLPATAFVSTP